jgi:hypothetical protein
MQTTFAKELHKIKQDSKNNHKVTEECKKIAKKEYKTAKETMHVINCQMSETVNFFCHEHDSPLLQELPPP